MGSWQLHRLQWKNDLILEISKSYKETPKNFTINSKLYSKVRINGKIIGQPIFVYALGTRGQYGYEVYIPVELKEIIVLTRVGWRDKKFTLNQNDIGSTVTFDAILLKPKRKNYFTPQNSKELIFYLDIDLIELNFKKELFPLVAENTSNFLTKYSMTNSNKINFPNNHLQYALTWYSLCFVIIIAFLIYKRKI